MPAYHLLKTNVNYNQNSSTFSEYFWYFLDNAGILYCRRQTKYQKYLFVFQKNICYLMVLSLSHMSFGMCKRLHCDITRADRYYKPTIKSINRILKELTIFFFISRPESWIGWQFTLWHFQLTVLSFTDAVSIVETVAISAFMGTVFTTFCLFQHLCRVKCV